MTAPQDIISDEEIARVHGNANFGCLAKRRVVDEGVVKYAFGYASGYTQLTILLEHGLLKGVKPGSYHGALSKKGVRYLRSLFRGKRIEELLDFAERG